MPDARPAHKACPLCSSADLSRLGKRSDFGDLRPYGHHVRDPARFDLAILRCGGCGLQFTETGYDDADLAELYSGPGYIELMQSMQHAAPTAEHLAAWRAEYTSLGMGQVAAQAAAEGRRPTMLDVGCGMGNALRIFDGLGFDVTGIDLSEPEIAYVRRTQPTAAVHCESAADHARRGQRYDVVLAIHVIEHVNDARAFLAELKMLAQPGGTVVLETPLTNDYGRAQERYRDVWHTLFFDHFTLALLASQVGLMPTTWQNLLSYGPGDWSWNNFTRVAMQPVAAASELRSLRAGYDGLLADADRWSRSAMVVDQPSQSAHYRSHNWARGLLQSLEREHPAFTRVRLALQATRRALRGGAFSR